MKSGTSPVVGSPVFAALAICTPILFAPSPTKLPLGRSQLLPASPEPPELIAEQQNAELALKNIHQERLSPQQKRRLPLNLPHPGIRAKAQEARRLKFRPMDSLDRPRPLGASTICPRWQCVLRHRRRFSLFIGREGY